MKVSLHFVYSFNGKIRLQLAGGAMGDPLTGAIASVFVIHWARLFKQKLSNINIIPKMLQILVDDQNIFTKATPIRAKFVNDAMVIDDEQIEIDRHISADIRTAKFFQSVSNSIYEFMQVTIDCPSQHETGFMPLLDIQVKMQQNRIIHKFYKKPISSNKVIMFDSALPAHVKKASIAEGAIRRLRYTDRSLPWPEVAEILSQYSNELRLSGYDHKYRAEIMESALKGFRRQCLISDSGGTPLFRSRMYERETRRKKKLMAREIWYRPSYNIIGFIPPTPGGELVKGIQKIVQEEGKKLV